MKVIAKQKAFAYQDVDWVSHLEVNANHFGRHKNILNSFSLMIHE
jgi:hypothetical protein